MGWDSEVLTCEGGWAVSVVMDSESALESSCCSSGYGIVSPVASAARCSAAGIVGLNSAVAGVAHGHQRTWSAYFCWRSRRPRRTSGRCNESGVYKTGQPAERG